MKNLKKLLFVLLIMFTLVPFGVIAEEEKQEKVEKEPVKLYIFHGSTCGYCKATFEWLDTIEEEYGKYFDVVEYLVYDANWNADEYYLNLMETVADEVGETVEGVPYIVIGEKTFPGYVADFDEDIKKAITDAYNDENYKDLVAEVENDIANEEEKPSYDGWIVAGIFIVILGGCGALVAFSRKK